MFNVVLCETVCVYCNVNFTSATQLLSGGVCTVQDTVHCTLYTVQCPVQPARSALLNLTMLNQHLPCHATHQY